MVSAGDSKADSKTLRIVKVFLLSNSLWLGTSNNNPFSIHNQAIEDVDNFCYLGTIVSKGCFLSPLVFNFVFDSVMLKATDNPCGISWGLQTPGDSEHLQQ